MTKKQTVHRQQTTSLGRDEINLADWPIGTLTATQPLAPDGSRPEELLFEVCAYDQDLNRVVPKRVSIRTASRDGFPTPLEERVLIGLFHLTNLRNGFSAPRVEFRLSEIFSLLGWSDSGSGRRKFKRALSRLQGVNLTFENSWSGENGAFEKTFATGLLDNYRLTNRTDDRAANEPCFIQWSAEVFADVQAGNLKELNTAEYFALKHPLAQRMYRFLDKHLARNPQFEMELLTFAAHLGIAERSHVGKIKERLVPSIVELETLPNFIAPLPATDRFRKQKARHWFIRFERPNADDRGAPPSAEPHRSVTNQSTPQPASAARDLVVAFHEQWTGQTPIRPSAKETERAQAVIDQYGFEKAMAMLPAVTKLLRQNWPDAKVFGATAHYWADAAKKQIRTQVAARKQAASAIEVADDEEQAAEQRKHRDQKFAEFRSLHVAIQDAIRKSVAVSGSGHVKDCVRTGKHDDMLVMMACVAEMERRKIKSAA